MKRESISNIIDGIISKSIKDGLDFEYIISDLSKRRESIFNIIKNKEYISYESILEIEPIDFEVKYRYVIYFVQISSCRIKDLNWAILNRDKLSMYNNKKIFDLLKLKSKLRNETHCYRESHR
jgi:hypothetical protein